MSFRNYLAAAGIAVLAAAPFMYLNCAPGLIDNNSASSAIRVQCTPGDNCLKYRLTTYSQLSCAPGRNRVNLQTLPSTNGGATTDVSWSGCVSVSNIGGCCQQGPVTGRFSQDSTGRSIAISWDNSEDNRLDQSNKAGEGRVVECPCGTGRLLAGEDDPEADRELCENVCETLSQN
ncbi:MAG TPA: hypothetical protein VFV50_07315 [Bdellovibrionales bacterium]|nr:hypothetical protein [Bdellovibrionales bacterium]